MHANGAYDDGTYRAGSVETAVRFHRLVSHHFSGAEHWPRELDRRAGRVLAQDRQAALQAALSFLVEGVRRRLRDGRGVGRGHGLPVRYQLGRLLEVRWADHRAAPDL